MDDSNKLWVINLADECDIEEPKVTPPVIRRNPPRPKTPVKRPASKAPVRRVAKPSPRLHFATKMIFSYLLGPFALFLWAEDRNKSTWSLISLFSGLGVVAIAWKWNSILALGSNGSLLIPLLAVSGIVSVLAFTSWARALYRAFASRTRSHTSWPTWMRSAWAITGLGFLVPGLGLYLAGSYRRAVAVAWSSWPVFLAALVLFHAERTWQWLQKPMHAHLNKEIYEAMIMVAVGILLLGFCGWIVQALAGLHRLKMSLPATSNVHGDRYAAALLLSVIALAVLSPSADLASLVNETGERLHQEGFQLIPLQLARSAQALDPGEINYSLQVASLHRERGETEEADSVQHHLDQNFQVYMGTLGQQASEPKAEPAVEKIPPKVVPQEAAFELQGNSWTWPLDFAPQTHAQESR
jgi:preprotein translocase subunit Sss1